MAYRDFSDFELGDDVYQLAGGMIPELIEKAGLDPHAENRTDVMGELVGILGKNKVLRENEPVEFLSRKEMADYVDRSGALLPLNRSLWTPHREVPEGTPRVITGAVANWQDRTANLLVEKAESLTSDVTVHIPIGNRVMDSPTEAVNNNIQKFQEQYRTLPTEAEYAVEFVVPKLAEAGYQVWVYSDNTKVGDKIAADFANSNAELFLPGRSLSFVRVANAGLQLALQFRNAARNMSSRYDTIKFQPQVFVETDTIEVARTKRQLATPQNYQALQPALRQVVLTAKLLHLATGEK